jgi:hypothetical protein
MLQVITHRHKENASELMLSVTELSQNETYKANIYVDKHKCKQPT